MTARHATPRSSVRRDAPPLLVVVNRNASGVAHLGAADAEAVVRGTGARVEVVTTEQHWYPIDRSVLGQRGVALHGPPPAEVFAEPRALLLPVVADAVRWHAGGAPRPDDAVLNACRAWRFAAEGVWSSKPEAGRWAPARGAPDVVADALCARVGGVLLDRRRIQDFLDGVAAAVERAAASARDA